MSQKNKFTLKLFALFFFLAMQESWATSELTSSIVLNEAKQALSLQDLETAHHLLEPLAIAGNAKAQYLMGTIYEMFLTKRFEESTYLQFSEYNWSCYPKTIDWDNEYDFKISYNSDRKKFYRNCEILLSYWMENAASQGIIKAQIHMARNYELGSGVPKNRELAIFWYDKAAQKGNVSAIRQIGLAYREGVYFTQDYKKARALFEKAIEFGNEYARADLGEIYERGLGVHKDVNYAKQLYYESAKKTAYGALMLGRLYSNGVNFPANYKEAAKWYEISSRVISTAPSELSKIHANLSAEDRRDAREKANEWRDKYY